MTYVGATARLTPDAIPTLGDGWGVQPKMDGCYAEAALDLDGRIAAVTGRNGRPVADGAELIGVLAGPPRSVLVGELEAHTEAGVAAYAAQGFRMLHLFDVLAAAGRDVRRDPYRARYDLLHSMQADLFDQGLGLVESWVMRGAGSQLRPRDPVSGRLVRAIPRDLRRLPIVPMALGADDALDLWDEHVEEYGGEGLVAVRLDARAGAPSSKRKVKLTDTIDARVVAIGSGAIRVAWRGGTSEVGWQERPEPFAVGTRRPLAPGDTVEVAHDGWYGSGVPRFARVVRPRKDKRAA